VRGTTGAIVVAIILWNGEPARVRKNLFEEAIDSFV